MSQNDKERYEGECAEEERRPEPERTGDNAAGTGADWYPYEDDTSAEEHKRLIVLPQKDMVVFEEMVTPIELEDTNLIEEVKSAMMRREKLFVVLRMNPEEEGLPTGLTEYHEVGTIVDVRQLVRLQSDKMRAFVVGVSRARLRDLTIAKGVLYGEVEEFPLEVIPMRRVEQEALRRALYDLDMRMIDMLEKKMPDEVVSRLTNARGLRQLVCQSMILMPIPVQLRQSILEAKNDIEQYQMLSGIIANEVEIMRIRRELKEKVQQEIDKNQKDYVLREQMKVIRSELGDTGESEAEELEKKVEALEASDEVKSAIRKEIKRYTDLGSNNSESSVLRNYLDTVLSLPWDKVSEDNTNLLQAKEVLERDHYGLKEVKERVTEYLAVHMRAKQADSPILCLVGPPGTGKTSIAKSIAEAMGRRYVRVSFGGVRDEAEIRGHRRTYVASMPGRIIQGMIQAGTSNPLMLFDEVDKLGNDFRGDPSSALLEVLDGAQNNRFVDHYVEIPVDMSRVMFIATANNADTIPRPLLDRMEVIEISSYLETEKVHIAKGHLIPKQMQRHGLTKKQLSWSDKAIRDMIEYYTREAGVRSLERAIGKVCRKIVLAIAEAEGEGKDFPKVTVTAKNLTDYLGRYRFLPEDKIGKPMVGVCRGLAWTSVGGTTLEIEVNILPGSGKLELTGSIGDVMKESAVAGISYLRSVLVSDADEEFFAKHDIHIHIPEGAVPKDGPSAGITMATAVYSAVTGKPVASNVAMTGEITLRGRVLPIGGLREKLLAAKSLGIRKVLIPAANVPSLSEIPEEVTDGMEIVPVKTMAEVLKEAIV